MDGRWAFPSDCRDLPLEEIAARVRTTPEEVQSWIDEIQRRGETDLERPQTDPVTAAGDAGTSGRVR